MPPITDRPEINKKIWGEGVKGSPTDLQEPSPTEIAAGWTPSGIKPAREWDNWLKYFLAKNLAFIESSGLFIWSNTIPYDQYGLAREGAQIYYSKVDTNIGNQPSTDGGTNWGKAGDIFQPETPVFLVVADEDSLSVGTADGQLRGTAAGNLYTWNDATAKWTARDGNVYAAIPTFTDVEYNDGTIAKIIKSTRRYNGSQWEYIGKSINQDITRANFVSSSSDNIGIEGFAGYFVDGIGWVWWDSTISYDLVSLAVDTWSYLYIDASTISGPGKITASNFIDSTTTPVYSQAKGGHYNGDDLCILPIYGLSSLTYLEFYHNKEDIIYEESIVDATPVVDTTYSDVTLTVPPISSMAIIGIEGSYIATDTSIRFRRNGSTNDTGLKGPPVSSANAREYMAISASVDNTGKIELKVISGTADAVIFTYGFKLGRGM